MPFVRMALKNARHAHMPDVTRGIMETGMCTDYLKVSELSRKLEGLVWSAHHVRVTNPNGTDLDVELNPS